MTALTFTLLALLSLPAALSGQGEVGVLRATLLDTEGEEAGGAAGEEVFTFTRNLIFFTGELDGKPGQFILDTGAPSLLVNTRGRGAGGAHRGTALGGELPLRHHRIESFRLAGREIGRRWVLGSDLRAMEARTGHRIDGYVGYDLLHSAALRIDYAAATFSLRKSERRPRHRGRAPSHDLRLTFSDHLPVVTLTVGGRKLRFAVDTGAGSNLIDPRHAELFAATDRLANLQGLDGRAATYPIFTTDLLEAPAVDFVALPLDELQSPDGPPLAGILGSDFLSRFTAEVDYRRRRLHLWAGASED